MNRLCTLLLALALGIVAQRSPTPQENLDRMLRLKAEHGDVIRINSDIFKKYVKSKHSKYSVVAMFTALKPNMKCDVCPEAKREFSILASSYRPESSDNPVFFVSVDYYDSQEAFQIMKLQHVPGFYYFPGGRKRLKSDSYSSRRTGYSAMALTRWLHDIDNIKIKLVIPFDYSKLIIPAVVTLLLGVLTYFKPGLVMEVLGNKVLWGVTIMSVVLLMTSGQMWNHIRKPAEAGRDGNGIQYIMGGRGGQYITETYIVMALNFAIAFGFILMNEVNSVKRGLAKKALGLIGLVMVVVFFGLLISIFRIKSRGYPYSFLFE